MISVLRNLTGPLSHWSNYFKRVIFFKHRKYINHKLQPSSDSSVKKNRPQGNKDVPPRLILSWRRERWTTADAHCVSHNCMNVPVWYTSDSSLSNKRLHFNFNLLSWQLQDKISPVEIQSRVRKHDDYPPIEGMTEYQGCCQGREIPC